MTDDYSTSPSFLEPLKRLQPIDPPPSVWEGIVADIERPEAKQVTLIAWPKIAAIAAVVLLLNTAGIFYAAQNSSSGIAASSYETEYGLVTDFQLYE